MICLDELQSTIKRINLIKDNSDSTEEQTMADILLNNLSQLLGQAKMLCDTPEFKMEVERRNKDGKPNIEK
jgi:hypothetical protein